MPLDQAALRKAILQFSVDRKLAHVGSCLSALPILCEIYDKARLRRPPPPLALTAAPLPAPPTHAPFRRALCTAVAFAEAF